MKSGPVLRRLAVVHWWIGTFCLAAGELGMLVVDQAHWWWPPALALVITVPSWALAYIVGGTILRPPKV